MVNDKLFLARAVEIATDGIHEGSGPFGAVIVKDGKIVAESANNVVRFKDPTAHAEILAIREASVRLGSHNLEDCVLYTSCEPCPMCMGAIYWSGIKRVVYASDRNDAADAGFNDRIIYDELALPLPDRSLQFYMLNIPAAKEVFKKWKDYEGKVNY
jgi:tRNA(Arg) A34 adenosine deaminase TadA